MSSERRRGGLKVVREGWTRKKALGRVSDWWGRHCASKGVFTYLWTNRNPGLEQEKGMELSQACALATVCAAHWRTLWSGRPSGTAAVNSSHRREGLSGLLWDRLPSATYREGFSGNPCHGLQLSDACSIPGYKLGSASWLLSFSLYI